MAYPGVSQQDPSRWSSSDRHQPTTAAPVPVAVGAPISNTPQESCYYTQSQADVSPPPITACEPQGVLDLSIDPGTYIAYSAGYYSQDQYTAQQRLPAQQQSAREVHAYSRSQQARRPSYPGLPSTTNPIVLTQRQAVQQLQRQQQQQQPQQTSPSTPGMYSSSSTSSPTTSVASFEGNILFWTSESHCVLIYNFFPFHSCLGLGSHSLISPLLNQLPLPPHHENLTHKINRATVNLPISYRPASQPPI